LINFCEQQAPRQFQEYVAQEQANLANQDRQSRFRMPGRLDSPELPQMAAGVPLLSDPARSWTPMRQARLAAAKRVRIDILRARDGWAQEMDFRARELLASSDYRFVGARKGNLFDQIDPRYAYDVEFDWFTDTIILRAKGSAPAEIWEWVKVECTTAAIAAPSASDLTSQKLKPTPVGAPRIGARANRLSHLVNWLRTKGPEYIDARSRADIANDYKNENQLMRSPSPRQIDRAKSTIKTGAPTRAK
jgi:hypothetical protein